MSRKGKWRSRRPIEEYIAKRDAYLSRRGLGKKESKKRKAIRIKNRKLCKRYPWLIPKNTFTGQICWGNTPYDVTELDAMPSGWRKAFEDVWCEEINKALRMHGINLHDFCIEQLKEKYGQLRCYSNYYFATKHVINAFEVISEHVCIACGALDAHLINDYNWWYPLCEDCYNRELKNKPSRYQISYEDRLKEAGISADDKIPTEYTTRTYHFKEDRHEEVVHDISDIVTKIRYKNKRRTHE